MSEPMVQIKGGSSIETRGVDIIPENERNSKASNVFYVLCGSQFAFGIMAIGSLPIVFGLGWWAAFWAITVGLAIGSLVIGPIAILSQRTGTNGALASGAHFGVKGRVVGSVLNIVIAMGFYALMVWTGAQAFVSGAHRLFGWPEGTGTLLIGCIVISAITATVAIMGHKIVVLFEKIGTYFVGAIVILSLFTFASQFNVSYEGGKYVLGGFWPTWFLAMLVVASVPISYAPFVGDYSRYVPNANSSTKLAWATSLGMFVGCWLAMLPASYMMSTVKDLSIPFVTGIIGGSPSWWVAPLALAGIFGSLPNGGLCLYSAGLSLETLGWTLKRVTTTIIMAAIGFILVLIGVFDVSDMIHLIDAFVIIIIVGVSPWLAINLVGHYLVKGRYEPLDLHISSPSSSYWYSSGFNISAVVSWAIGLVVGLLFTGTSVFTGPLVQVVGGIDLSFTSSAVVGALLYYILRKIFPYDLKEVNSEITQNDVVL
ncbi:purine-cytosine permease family protein [Aneurinibacillus tyrosinisolvens]|uniref:purine-cytosine permease family protein n=1 Tax=Aneurinibacillus tyrosinisolvens TaxID=1443435 RepID=UPI00069A97C0|nr:cytosine permease [Aneurinibacillus tyrosinisolvens]